MQVRGSFFVVGLVALGLAVACGDSASPGADDDGDDDDGSSSSGRSSSGNGGSSSGAGSTSSSSSGGGSSSGGSSSGGQSDASTIPPRPAECQVIPAFTLANGPGLTPSQYGAQPTFRGVVVTPGGEPVLEDMIHVRVDASTAVGSYELAPPGTDTNCYEHGAQCMYLHEDVFSGSSNAFFVAVAGRIRITEQTTTDQSAGVIDYVELREASIEKRNVPYNQANLVADGACYWVENAEFDTRRADGCDPLGASTCGANKTCVAENAAGSDGTCRGYGNGTNLTPCTQQSDGSTNCGAEYACSLDTTRVCRKKCDILSANNECPTATVCSTFGYCEPQTVETETAFDEDCDAFGHFCGNEGAYGLCFPQYDAQGQQTAAAVCGRLERTRSACPAGQDLGFIEFDGILDRSMGRCVPAL